MSKSKGCVAWLVTWEWMGDHAKSDDKIAAILNPRWSKKKVAEYVEFIYAQKHYSNSDKLKLATGQWKNPYPIQYATLAPGVSWEGMMFCGGDDPLLRARKVNNLRIEKNDDGTEKVLWDERPKPPSPV